MGTRREANIAKVPRGLRHINRIGQIRPNQTDLSCFGERSVVGLTGNSSKGCCNRQHCSS